MISTRCTEITGKTLVLYTAFFRMLLGFIAETIEIYYYSIFLCYPDSEHILYLSQVEDLRIF